MAEIRKYSGEPKRKPEIDWDFVNAVLSDKIVFTPISGAESARIEAKKRLDALKEAKLKYQMEQKRIREEIRDEKRRRKNLQ